DGAAGGAALRAAPGRAVVLLRRHRVLRHRRSARDPLKRAGGHGMAHLVLQDVDPRVIESLSARAARQGRSVEEEARAVLEGALGLSRQRALEAARQLRAQWAGRSLAAR